MLQPTDKLSVTLEAQTWNIVMQVLGDGPFRVVAPIIQDMQRQCAEQDRSEGGTTNGLGPAKLPPKDAPAWVPKP